MSREKPTLSSTVSGARVLNSTAKATDARLHVVFPRELARVFQLRSADTTIGRDPGIDGFLLDHGTISRRHAALVWNPAQRTHALRDLGSRNGSQADGVPALADEGGDAGARERLLVNGSLLRLGDTLLIYEQGAPTDGADDADDASVSRDAVPGQAAAIRHLRAVMARAAADPAPVLIRGETGTGKERIAREIHRLSGRSGKLVALNCAALSAHIVEAQLFGHAKGAFTGAVDAQPGLFRAAHGGTLFLDEIGDLPLDIQPKLLRALQEGEILPVGATQSTRVDVRIVAATHQDLTRAMHARTFREDLYARLSLWELDVPPLRERRVDLFAWVDRLHDAWATARRNDARGPVAALTFDADAAEMLLRFSWPLNLRGVERLVHELTAADGRTDVAIGRRGLPAWLGTNAAPRGDATPQAEAVAAPTGDQARGNAVPTREQFTEAFQELNGSIHGLARRFARDRRQIYRWVEAYGLAEHRPPPPSSHRGAK